MKRLELVDEQLGEQPRATKRMTVSTRTNEGCLRLQNQDGLLLPGVPNEITLDKIVPKLPSGAFHVLSSVSRKWQQAIQNHEVHDARVRAHSTETLVVLSSSKDYLNLYSPRDGGYHRLPGIPHLETGRSRWQCRLTSLDGKIYVFGGFQEEQVYRTMFRTMEVWVLDLAGQRKWEKRASIEKPKYNFWLGALSGKIYVFGGVYGDPGESEVYDPKENSWSRIAPMLSCRESFDVVTMGEELFIYGLSFEYKHPEGVADLERCMKRVLFLEVYHPVKDEWRSLQPLEHKCSGVWNLLVAAHGKLHMVTHGRIDVYDLEKNTWSHLRSFSMDDYAFNVSDMLAVDDELLAIGSIWFEEDSSFEDENTPFEITGFRRSKGFFSNGATLLWERVRCSYVSPFYEWCDQVCTVQL